MIKFSQLRMGDYVIAHNEGDAVFGEVVALHASNKQACVDTGIQDFWYNAHQLEAIPLTESTLVDFKFKKQVTEEGSVKYSKGAFRMMLPKENEFSKMEIWYRDEHRHIMEPISVHQLQNHFYEITKVYLDEKSFD